MTSNQRVFVFGMTIFAFLITGLQIYGGAYQAEFDAHSDEASHFVSSLLVHDYICQFPWPSPLPWAADYYVHYPKVAIGHWPPGYYVIQALWWLVSPPGRASAMGLNVAMGLGCMAIFLVVARRIRESWPPVVAGIAILFLPIMQEAHAQVMAELPSLLCMMWLLWSLTRFLEEPGAPRYVVAVLGALAGVMAMKGTGVAVLGAPVIALALSGVWRLVPKRYLIGVPLAGAVVITGLFLLQYRGEARQIAIWGGLLSRIPWGVNLLPEIVGFGILAMAALGAGVAFWRRQPAMVAALSIVLSFFVTSYFVRAMHEDRHWIGIVPMLALLGLAAFAWLETRWRWVSWLAGALIVWTFPYWVYQQESAGFGALASQLRLPARMLFSSYRGWREGPWIAVVSLREPRPSSTIVRATKLLAASDWNGRGYRSLVHTPEDIERKLDESAIDVVVLDNVLWDMDPAEIRAHHRLLMATLRVSPYWNSCASVGELLAYCRIQPPRFPRQPMQIDMQKRFGQDFKESLP